MTPAELAARLRERYPEVVVARGEATVIVDRTELLDALTWVKDEPDLGFDTLSFVSATDHPGDEPRFWLTYQLRSLGHHHFLRVKVGASGEDPRVPSVTSLYPTANWHERETYDFYGVVFDGHPDLTRILLPDDWEGFPLRKDEELGGVTTRFHGAFIPPVDERTS